MSQKQQNLRNRLTAFFMLISACAFAGPFVLANNRAKVSEEALAQQRQVAVSVLDESGQPAIGAGVMVVSTRTGGVTGLDGKTTVQAKPGDKLEITYIGYETQTVTVGQSGTVSVVMVPSALALEETVVVGYGTQKKESVVASIAQVGNENLRKTGNTSDLTESLIGQIPGLVTTTSSGEPGGILTGDSATNVYIRGRNTWNTSGPLILVDGVERNMNNIDVNEVERISVLKDASATAVFGVKGANGVILITTKRGTEGKTRLNFNYTLTGKMLSKQPDKLDSYDALTLKNLTLEREGVLDETAWNEFLPYKVVERFKRPQSDENSVIYPNVDWEKALFKNFSLNTHKLSATVQGGGKKIKYFGSLAYLHEGDMFVRYDNYKTYDPNYNFDRFNFRSNVDFDLTKTTHLKFNLAGFFSRKNTNWNNEGTSSRADSWMWSATYFLAPDMYLPKYEDGRWGTFRDGQNTSVNPAAIVYNIGLRQTRQTQLNADFHINQDLDFITKGLKASASIFYDNTIRSEGGVYDNGNSARSSEASTNVPYEYIDYSLYTGPGQDPSEYTQILPPSSGDYDWVIRPWTYRAESVLAANFTSYIPVTRRMMYQLQLNWAREFGKHSVTATGVFKREEYARGSMFKNYREDWVGRVTYDYDNRYLVELNGAYNGSEQFGPGYRFAFFPSVALGWYISNEPWFKVNWMNKFKLRYSIGDVGNDNVSSTRWLYQTQYRYKAGRAPINKDMTKYSPYYFYNEQVVGNPNVHWEKARKTNYGVETSFLKDLVTLNFDYYTEHRTDILLSGSARTIPIYYGALTAPAVNAGEVKSRGWELELGINKQIGKNLLIWAKANINHNENEVIFRDDPRLQLFYLKHQGYQIGQSRSQLATEIYQNWDEIYASVPQETNDNYKLPGFYDIIDFNSDGLIKSSEDTPPTGYSVVPQNTYSWIFGTSYKGWDFMVQFIGANNANRTISFNNYQNKYNVVFGHARDYWSKENPNASSFLPRYQTEGGEFKGDFFVYDASYVRLQTIELSYRFSKNRFLDKIHCSNLRLFVNGNNLFFWSDLPDDRTDTNSAGSATGGAYPTLKRINFGIDLSF